MHTCWKPFAYLQKLSCARRVRYSHCVATCRIGIVLMSGCGDYSMFPLRLSILIHACRCVKVNGVRRATPLLLVLVCIELSDVVFAADSIPAVFGVTKVSRNILSPSALEFPSRDSHRHTRCSAWCSVYLRHLPSSCRTPSSSNHWLARSC